MTHAIHNKYFSIKLIIAQIENEKKKIRRNKMMIKCT